MHNGASVAIRSSRNQAEPGEHHDRDDASVITQTLFINYRVLKDHQLN